MTVDQMRAALIKAYPAPKWAKKVMGMHENQILTLYLKFKREGKIT